MPLWRKDHLLEGLPKSPTRPQRRSPNEWYHDKCIKWQLAQDALRGGLLASLNLQNQQNRLLSLPAEVRNTVWELAILPSRDPNPVASHGSYVCIFDRSTEVYPGASVLLISRDIYRETLQMYAHFVSRYWMDWSFHLEVESYTNEELSVEHWIHRMRAKVESLKDANLKSVKRLRMATPGSWLAPQEEDVPEFIYDHGTWHGLWISRRGRVTKHFIVPIKGELRTGKRLKIVLKDVPWQMIRLTWISHGTSMTDNDMDAILLPGSTDGELLQTLNAIAGPVQVTRKILRVMLWLQWTTRGRH